MKPTTLYILILMLATCLAACSINDFPEEENTPGGSGTLRIAYRVAGSSVQTRATEPGVDALNENTVTRLDFFAFKSNGSLLCHAPFTAEAGGSLYSANYTLLAISEETLSLEDVQGNTGGSYYLVANCPAVATTITTLSDLQAALTNGTGNPALITTDGTAPTAFIMDAKATEATSGKDITLSFDLRRAAAKIRIRFAEASTGTPTHCKLFQQAASTHVLAEAETYDNSATDWADFREITADFPQRDNSTDGQGGYVFYSYPNDWFNSTLYTQEENSNYTCNDEGLHNGEPIMAAKQTYLLLRATYEGTEYYYKIPVNRRLPSFSDNPTFTAEEYEQIHDLYRLKRNHLYDVAVTISGPGGTMDDPVVPAYTITINDWVNGHPDGDDGRYELPPDAFVEARENKARHDSETHPLSSTSVILNEVKDLTYCLALSVPYARCFTDVQHDNGQQLSSVIAPCHPERRRQPQSKDLTYRAALSALDGRCFDSALRIPPLTSPVCRGRTTLSMTEQINEPHGRCFTDVQHDRANEFLNS